jgi:hypothetical protein
LSAHFLAYVQTEPIAYEMSREQILCKEKTIFTAIHSILKVKFTLTTICATEVKLFITNNRTPADIHRNEVRYALGKPVYIQEMNM